MKRKDTPLPSSDDIINKAASSAAKAHKKALYRKRSGNVLSAIGKAGSVAAGLFMLNEIRKGALK